MRRALRGRRQASTRLQAAHAAANQKTYILIWHDRQSHEVWIAKIRASGAKATKNSRNNRNSAVASCPFMPSNVLPPCDKVLVRARSEFVEVERTVVEPKTTLAAGPAPPGRRSLRAHRQEMGVLVPTVLKEMFVPHGDVEPTPLVVGGRLQLSTFGLQLLKGYCTRYRRVPKCPSDVVFCRFGFTSRNCGYPP